MADYSEEIATALELIAEFGEQCEWRHGELVDSDSDRPWVGGVRNLMVYEPFICFLPATDGASGFGMAKFRKDSEVASFSTFGLMGAQNFIPKVTDRVTRGGQVIVVKHIDTLQPAGQPVLYILEIE